MKVAQVFGDEILVNNVDDISLNGRNGAIIKVIGCGLCGSDIVKYRHKTVKDGVVLGHEIVGYIHEIKSDTDFKVGQKIVTSHHIPCGECDYCRHGNVSMCEHFKLTNLEPGGFSEYVYVTEEHLKNVAYVVPENISDEEISFYEPLSCCVRAINRTKLIDGDRALVVGLGSIGLIMAQALKAMGFDVYACDLLEDRIELAKSKGINAFNSINDELSINFDAIFMTSGADKAIDVALKYVKQGGKILVFSSTPLSNGYPNNEIYYKELTVLGSYSPSPSDLKISYELLISKKVDVKGLTTTYSINNIQQAFEDTITNKVYKVFVKM